MWSLQLLANFPLHQSFRTASGHSRRRLSDLPRSRWRHKCASTPDTELTFKELCLHHVVATGTVSKTQPAVASSFLLRGSEAKPWTCLPLPKNPPLVNPHPTLRSNCSTQQKCVKPRSYREKLAEGEAIDVAGAWVHVTVCLASHAHRQLWRQGSTCFKFISSMIIFSGFVTKITFL